MKPTVTSEAPKPAPAPSGKFSDPAGWQVLAPGEHVTWPPGIPAPPPRPEH